jgi:hypothetical protein
MKGVSAPPYPPLSVTFLPSCPMHERRLKFDVISLRILRMSKMESCQQHGDANPHRRICGVSAYTVMMVRLCRGVLRRKSSCPLLPGHILRPNPKMNCAGSSSFSLPSGVKNLSGINWEAFGYRVSSCDTALRKHLNENLRIANRPCVPSIGHNSHPCILP